MRWSALDLSVAFAIVCYQFTRQILNPPTLLNSPSVMNIKGKLEELLNTCRENSENSEDQELVELEATLLRVFILLEQDEKYNQCYPVLILYKV